MSEKESWEEMLKKYTYSVADTEAIPPDSLIILKRDVKKIIEKANKQERKKFEKIQWDFKNFWMFDILNEVLLNQQKEVSKKYNEKGLKVFEKNKFSDFGQICLCIEYLNSLRQNMSDIAEGEY